MTLGFCPGVSCSIHTALANLGSVISFIDWSQRIVGAAIFDVVILMPNIIDPFHFVFISVARIIVPPMQARAGIKILTIVFGHANLR